MISRSLSRVRKLEAAIAPKRQERFRVIIELPWKRLDLAKSTCKRYVCHSGVLMEVVHLDGDGEQLSAEDLEKFVESFPIGAQRAHASKTVTQAQMYSGDLR